MASADPAAGPGGDEGVIRVEVAWSPGPRDILLATLSLPAGSRLVDALRASPWPAVQRLPEAPAGSAAAVWTSGVWGRPRPADHVLRDGDRVEVWRPLAIDPKDARRERSDRAGGLRALWLRQQALRARRTPG